MVGLVIDYQKAASPQPDPVAEVGEFEFFGWRLETKDSRHRLRFFAVSAIRPLVKLLNVGQEESAFRMGLFAFAANHAIEVPENLKLLGDHRISAEDRASCKVQLEPLKHNHVGRKDQKRGRIILRDLFRLAHSVKKLPSHSQ